MTRELEQLSQKLLKIERCILPLELDRSSFNIVSVERTAESLALFAGDMLIRGFKNMESLYEVCNFVTRKLAKRQGGQWLCTIWPFDIEVGLGINDFSSYLAELE